MFRRKRPPIDFEDEIRAHLDLEETERAAEGMPLEDAHYAARRAFGNQLLAREQFYERDRLLWWDHLRQDMRYAIRTLFRAPAFAVAGIATLALGIGANVAIFSVVRAVLLKPLSYATPDRIVVLEPFYKGTGRTGTVVSAPDFHDWQRMNHVFQSLAYHTGGDGPVIAKAGASFVNVQAVTPDFFGVFGLPPTAGRYWSAAENRAGVAVISHRWAEAQFGTSQAALGQTIRARGKAVEVIGVAASGFRYPESADIWIPAGLFDENPHRSGHNYYALGRMRSDVSLGQTRQDMRQIGDRLGAEHAENRYKTVSVTRLAEKITARSANTLWVLLGAVAGVLLISCANVANLQLARASTRTREMAVRASIGAGRGRILRQVLTESLVLGGLGAVGGTALAWVLLRALPSIAPTDIPRLDEVRVDAIVLMFAVVLGGVSGLLFGLAPLRTLWRPDLQSALRASSGKGTTSHVGRATRTSLIVAEVALSMVLLASAGVLVRSLIMLTSVDLGFSPHRLLITSTSIPVDTLDEARRATEFQRDLIDRISTLPGVRLVAGVRITPFEQRPSTATYTIEGGRSYGPGEAPSAHAQTITPRYFETMGMALNLGRDFGPQDAWGRPQVAIVNEVLAREAFGDSNPLGRRIRSGLSAESMNGMEIVGVVRAARQVGPGDAPRPEVFVPYLQHPFSGSNLALVVRSTIEPQSLSSSIRETARNMNPELPVRFTTLDEIVRKALAYPRFRAALIGLFAILAAGLAVVGIYSVISYVVSQRRNEIGIRLALGASPSEVFRSVVSDSTRPVVGGLMLGWAGTLLTQRVLGTFLFGVTPHDPSTIVIAIVTLALAAVLGSCLPALRAARVDPLIALRES